MSNVEWVIKIIRDLSDAEYTGKLELNFFRGGIANVNKFESIKPQPETG